MKKVSINNYNFLVYPDEQTPYKFKNFSDSDGYYFPIHQDSHDLDGSGDLYFYLPAKNEDNKYLYFKVYIAFAEEASVSHYAFYDFYSSNNLILPPSEEPMNILGISSEFYTQYINHFVHPASNIDFDEIGAIPFKLPVSEIGMIDYNLPVLLNKCFSKQFTKLYPISDYYPLPVPLMNVTMYFSITEKHNCFPTTISCPVFSTPLPFIFSIVSDFDDKLKKTLLEILNEIGAQTNLIDKLHNKSVVNFYPVFDSSTKLSKSLFTPPSSPPCNTACIYSTYDNEDGFHLSPNYKFANTIPGLITCSHPLKGNNISICNKYNSEDTCVIFKKHTETISTDTVNSNSDTFQLVSVVTKDSSNYYEIINNQTNDCTHSFVVPDFDENGQSIDHVEHAINVYKEVISVYDHQQDNNEDHSQQTNSNSYIMSLLQKV